MKYAWVLLVMACAIACSSDPSQSKGRNAQTDDPEKGIICTNEPETGSVLKKKKCTTPEEREAQRRQAEQLDIQRSRGDAR